MIMYFYWFYNFEVEGRYEFQILYEIITHLFTIPLILIDNQPRDPLCQNVMLFLFFTYVGVAQGISVRYNWYTYL